MCVYYDNIRLLLVVNESICNMLNIHLGIYIYNYYNALYN